MYRSNPLHTPATNALHRGDTPCGMASLFLLPTAQKTVGNQSGKSPRFVADDNTWPIAG